MSPEPYWGAVLAIFVLSGLIQLWALYVLAFCFGAIDALFYAAFDSMAPLIVDTATGVLAVLGVATGFMNVMMFTWRQTRTAEAMIGRVMSLAALASVGLLPVSLAASGALASINVTLLFVVAGGVTLLEPSVQRPARRFARSMEVMFAPAGAAPR